MSVKDVRDTYTAIFLAQVRNAGRAPSYALRVGHLPDRHVLATLVNENESFFGYLLNNAIDTSGLDQVLHDPVDFHSRFTGILRSSSRLDAIVIPMVARYLSQEGLELTGLDPSHETLANETRPEVELETAASIAARFFYPHEIGPGDQIQAHICAALNGLSDLQRPRDLAVEAFVYSALWRDLRSSRRGVRHEFTDELKRLASLDLSSNLTIRLHRVQGAVWAHMSRSRRVRRALSREYARMERWLPFRLVSSSSNDPSGESRVNHMSGHP
jgi:hypothetical protein